METTNFFDFLPEPDCPVRDAVYALADNMPFFSREWLFEVDAFVQVFRDRFVQIVSTLPEDSSRKELEIELAHIQHKMNMEHWLIINATETWAILRTIEENLTEAWVFEAYKKFSEGVLDKNLVIDGELFGEYLYYLYEYAQYNIQNVFIYLLTLLKFSQAVEWSDVIIIAHLRAIGDKYDQEQVDVMVSKYGYLWGVDQSYDDHILNTMEEDPELTHDEARDFVDDFIEQNARIHIFLAYLWNNNVCPYYANLTKIEQAHITHFLNDFRDIIDPEWYIPIFFYNGNWHEVLMRNRMIEDWRDVH